MAKPGSKYIAEGFVEDSGKLLNEVLQLNSMEFKDFAKIWRKNHFSLIFMGRPDFMETSEFVNEIFRITTQYLLEKSFPQKVGAVFLLYALYRNQISEPPIKIRLELKHMDAILFIRKEAHEKKYKTLHYVVDYLIEHAFVYVNYQTLRGPLIAGLPTAHDVAVSKLKTEYQHTLTEYNNGNSLATLRDLQKQYMEEKKKLAGCASVRVSTSHELYDKAIKELDKLVVNQLQNEPVPNVGVSKTKLKCKAFQKKAKTKYEDISKRADEIVSATCSKDGHIKSSKYPVKVENKPKPRKEDRRPGRPSMKPKPPSPKPEPESEDEDIDISHLLVQQKELYLPPVYGQARKKRTKRDPYYQLSPKRVETDSDSESEKDSP